MLLDAGATVGRYLILDVLGSGGMSVVYGAYDPQLDRRVALKLMRTPDDGRDAEHVRDRLLREGQALARLSHPNVVTVHDVGTLGDQVFVAMEYVEGPTLTEWLRRPHSRGELLRVFRAAGEGLAAAHAVGLIHRDFKPDNVMIDGHGRVRVMDFGLARPSGTPSSDTAVPESDQLLLAARTSSGGDAVGSGDALGIPLTVTGAVMGTPAYMAPEQHCGGRAGPATDQFSFCVALFEALYGQRPFDGANRAALRSNVLHGRLREPPRRRGVPWHLRRAILRGLSVHPMHRWPSMTALLEELDRVPRRRRRRLAVVLAGLTVAGVALMMPRSDAPGPDQAAVARCGEAQGLDGVWDRQVVESLDDRFTTATVPWVQGAWIALRERIDGYAEGLAAARERACAEDPDPNDPCQAELRRRLAVVTLPLDRGDALAIQLAQEELLRLPSPQACAEAGTEGSIEIVPEGRHDALRSLQQELLAVRRRLLEGAGDDARARAQALRLEAEASEHPSIAIEVALAHGEALAAVNRPVEAEAVLEQSWHDAVATGHDGIAIAAATEMVRVMTAQARSREALRWARDARAFIQRSDRGPLEWSRLRLAEAGARAQQGQVDLARGQLHQALESRQALFGERSPAAAEVVLAQARIERQWGDARAALEHYELASRWLIESLGAEHLRVAEVDLELGALLRSQGERARGLDVIERALGSIRASVAADEPRMARTLVTVADEWSRARQLDRALQAYAEAETIVRAQLEESDPLQGVIDHHRGLTWLRQGRYEDAAVSLRAALAAHQAHLSRRDPRVAAVLDDLAVVERALGNRGDALDHHERAEGLWHTEAPGGLELARSLTRQGRVLIEVEHLPMADAKLQQALAILASGVSGEGVDAVELEARWATAVLQQRRDRHAEPTSVDVQRIRETLLHTELDDPTLREAIEAWLARVSD